MYRDISQATEATVRTERLVEPSADAAELLGPLFKAYTASYAALHDVHDLLAERRRATSA